jgi:YD repeat-containing protein
MKKSLFLLLSSALVITACKKDNSSTTPTPTGSTILLTKITNNISGDPAFGKTFIEFSYNGKQLTKEVLYSYKTDGSISNAETTTFTYDSNANLTGTTITNSNSAAYVSNVSATITATGSNITEFKLYGANNVLNDDITFTYQNGKLASSTSANEGINTYTYNSDGNNTQRVTDHALLNKSFDTKSNLSSALPYWVYFAYIQFPDGDYQGVPLHPGTHNVLSFDDGSGNTDTYTYQYNDFGYPSVSTSTLTATNGNPLSYKYEYIQVN